VESAFAEDKMKKDTNKNEMKYLRFIKVVLKLN